MTSLLPLLTTYTPQRKNRPEGKKGDLSAAIIQRNLKASLWPARIYSNPSTGPLNMNNTGSDK